jgi:hypothetical protein
MNGPSDSADLLQRWKIRFKPIKNGDIFPIPKRNGFFSAQITAKKIAYGIAG